MGGEAETYGCTNARLPIAHNLDLYDISMSNGFSFTRLNLLRGLHLVDEGFNFILAAPCGVGTTSIALRLCADVIGRGYRTCFRNMKGTTCDTQAQGHDKSIQKPLR